MLSGGIVVPGPKEVLVGGSPADGLGGADGSDVVCVGGTEPEPVDEPSLLCALFCSAAWVSGLPLSPPQPCSMAAMGKRRSPTTNTREGIAHLVSDRDWIFTRTQLKRISTPPSAG